MRAGNGSKLRDYSVELICNAEKEPERLKGLWPLIKLFSITPSYYVDKTNVQQHPLYSRFSAQVTNSERSLTINHVLNLDKNRGKYVLMLESDVKPQVELDVLKKEIDKVVQQMKDTNVDIVFLGRTHLPGADTSNYEEVADTLYKTGNSRCTDSYIISPGCINKYLEYVNSISTNQPADLNYDNFFKAKPQVVACWKIPELFDQDKSFKTTLTNRS